MYKYLRESKEWFLSAIAAKIHFGKSGLSEPDRTGIAYSSSAEMLFEPKRSYAILAAIQECPSSDQVEIGYERLFKRRTKVKINGETAFSLRF